MKISKSILAKICIVAGFIFTSQLGFASNEVPIPKDGSIIPPSGQMNGLTTEFPTSATISDTDLAVYFDWSVGDATITV